MRRARLGLWSYLALIVGAIVSIALASYGVYDAQERADNAQSSAVQDASDLAQTVAASSAHFMITGAYDSLEQTLLRLAKLGRVKSIEVFDAEGGLVSAVLVQDGRARPSFAPRAFKPPAQQQQVLGAAQLSTVTPIERGTLIGWVRTSTSLDALNGIRMAIWIETAVLLLATLAFVLAGLGLALRRATQPLAQATQFAESLTSRRGQQLELRTPVREIGDLAQALNRLSLTLREQQAALAASELRKSAILEASLDCLITIDATGRIVEFNPAAERTFRYSRVEAVGRTMSELIVPPALRAAHEAGMKRYLASGHGPVLRKRIELRAVDRDGREFPVEVVIVPFDIDGQPYFAGYLRDISEQQALEQERAEAEAALRMQTERMKVGQSAAGLLIMDWDIVRDELIWSDSPEWLRGPVPAGSGAYPPFLQQVHPQDREAFVAMRKRAVSDLTPEAFEYRVVRTDGEVRWVDSRHLVFPGPDGKAARMIIALHDITERQRALEAARSAQEKLERLLASSRIVVYIDQPTHEFHCVYMSENAEAVLGFGAPEFLADPGLWASRVHPDDLPAMHRDLDQLLAIGHFEHEYRFLHRDGAYRWMRDEQTLRRNEDGAAAEIVGAWWDITERKETERLVAAARDRAIAAESTLSATLENVSQGIIMADAQRRIAVINRRAVELLGLPPELAVPGRSVKDIVDWELAHGEFGADPRQVAFFFDATLNVPPSPQEQVFERTRPNGTVLEIRRVIMQDGRVVRTYSDITERKRVAGLLERSVRELEGQKFALDEHAIVSITDPDGAIVYANDKFLQVSGYSRAELLGATHRLIKSGQHPPEFYREMWDTIRAGRAWHGEIVNRNKGGALYWVASTIVPLLDAGGRPRQYIAIRTNITEQKNTALALAEASERELSTGHAIQQSLLLGLVPELEQLEIAAFAQPSQGVDGDFYEFFAVHARCCDVLVGDVMGKGTTAALMGAGVKSQYGRVLAELLGSAQMSGELPQPRAIVNRLHSRLTNDLIRLDAFVTLAYCRIDLQLGRLSYISAGHTPAILVDARGALTQLQGHNLPIGVRADEHYTETEHVFDEGDLLFLYSDGVTEARNAAGEEFGLARLSDKLRELRLARVPPAMLVQCVRGAVQKFTGTKDWKDDFTLVAVQHQVSRMPLHYEEFARDLAELSRLREWVDNLSAAFLPEDCVQRLVLAAVEIASNIVRHADVPVRAAAFLCHHEVSAAELRLHFYYLGTPYDRSQVAPPDFSGAREGGFGLYIVENSVDEFSQSVIAEDVNRLSLVMQRHAAGESR